MWRVILIVLAAVPAWALDFSKGDQPPKGATTYSLHLDGVAGVPNGTREKGADATQIYVARTKDTAGVLQKGDVILGVDGQRFERDVIDTWRAAVARSKRSDADGKLSVIRWRAGTVETVELLSLPAPPDFTKGGLRDETHDWTLGPTGARGWIWGKDLETTRSRQILITKVFPSSPADGILQEGDVIMGVSGKLFAEDARKVFGRAITEAETLGRLNLIRWRKGQQSDVVITIPALGAYRPTAPFDCPKTKRIVDAQCAYLLKHGFGDGVPGNVNALGALATGRSEFAAMLKAHARKLAPPNLKLNVESGGMAAWDWGYANVFLTEYYLATKDEAVFPAIREYAVNTAKGQSGVGSWGHGMAWTKINGGRLHGSLGGYGALNQSGLISFLSLTLAKECGVKDREVDEAIGRATKFFGFYINRGAIPYGDHGPWHDHDDNGKCSSGAVVFDLLGNREAATFFSRMTTASWAVREGGHTGNYFSFLWGPLGAGRAGPDAAAAFLREHQWFLDLERKWDGSSEYQGGAGMGGGEDSYRGWDCTGARLLANSLPLHKLRITGKGAGVAAPLKGKELKEVIEADRDLLWSTKDDIYAGRETEELYRLIGSWSPAVRWKAAKALAGKGDDTILPRVMKLLEGRDQNTRYGACMTLEQMKERGAPAVPKLTALLTDKDLELRIRAVNALAGIGAPACPAIPALLQLSFQSYPDDPREFTQRYLSVALFGQRGLLSQSVVDVDRQLLFRAVEKLLQNEDGHARSAVAGIYNRLTFEELRPLWPAIVRAIEVPAPSGEMFAAGVRDSGLRLLAEQHVKEAIPLLVQYARNQQQWGSQDRIVTILKLLEGYGVSAKETVPELRKLAEWCRTEEGFPEWARVKKREAIEAAIQRIEAATDKPALISIGKEKS